MFGWLQTVLGGNPVLLVLLLLPVVFQLVISILYIVVETMQKRRGAF